MLRIPPRKACGPVRGRRPDVVLPGAVHAPTGCRYGLRRGASRRGRARAYELAAAGRRHTEDLVSLFLACRGAAADHRRADAGVLTRRLLFLVAPALGAD